MKHFTFAFIAVILFLIYHPMLGQSSDRQYVVVLDAGHGGKDPGNRGNGYIEKDIALKVTLKVGEILKKHKDIKVVYTRTTDVFVELDQRAKIANHEDADLFVSVHLNSFRKPSVYGTETFVLGTYRNKDNLDIAMRENSVIYLEEDYKETYNGFDPTDPASYIGMTLMQEEYLEQSILLADNIQRQYTNKLKRHDRGVKESGFLVLRETFMPSVLTEIGFLTNKTEGAYLNSAQGQNQISQSIAQGIVDYKNALNLHATQVSQGAATTTTTPATGVSFKIQLAVGSKPLETAPFNFKGLQNVERDQEGKLYKYYYGNTPDYLKAQEMLREAREKGYPEAFLVAYRNGQKISVEEALKLNAK